MSHRRKFHRLQTPRAAQGGFSLVELIVAMVIGLTVVGAALAMYVSSGFSGRGSSAMSQMTEDASIALSLLRSQIAMAGYGQPTGASSGGILTTSFTGRAIFGCTGGPTAYDAAVDAMTCNNSAAPDSIVVRYQADTRNTVPTSDATPEATDCLGAGLTPAAGVAIAENSYYVTSTNNLACRGNGGGNPQPLVENITDLKITYGVAGTTAGRAVQYVTAQDVGTTPADARWNKVTSVRICVVVRSDSQVLDEATTYYNCAGTPVNPTNKYLYRAFTTTVVLQNRIQ